MAVRAIVKDGAIHPTGPLPDDWTDGKEVSVSAIEEPPPDEDLDRWADECDRLATTIDAEDAELMTRAINEHRAEAKAAMRREMGLP